MKELVKVYLNKDKGNYFLSIKTKDGVERFLDVFNGGGYYEALTLQTKEEIDEMRIIREKADEDWRKSVDERVVERKSKKWYQFWK